MWDRTGRRVSFSGRNGGLGRARTEFLRVGMSPRKRERERENENDISSSNSSNSNSNSNSSDREQKRTTRRNGNDSMAVIRRADAIGRCVSRPRPRLGSFVFCFACFGSPSARARVCVCVCVCVCVSGSRKVRRFPHPLEEKNGTETALIRLLSVFNCLLFLPRGDYEGGNLSFNSISLSRLTGLNRTGWVSLRLPS